jgi:hypothetical protein
MVIEYRGTRDPRMTALARTRTNCEEQIPPLVREGAPHQHTRNCLTVIKIWYWAPEWGLTPRQSDRLTVDCNITLTLTLLLLFRELLGFSRCGLMLWEVGSWGRGAVRESRGRGMSTVGSHYQATAIEDCNRLRISSVSYSDLWSVN